MHNGTGSADGPDGSNADTSTVDATIRILCVDDDPSFLDMVTPMLERHDDRFQIHTATTATQALSIIEELPIDCVVSDYALPETNGIDLLRSLRERETELPFVLLTGRGSEQIASDAIGAGVDEYLLKDGDPAVFSELATRLISIVTQANANHRLEAHLNRMTDAFYALDTEWRFTFLNDRAVSALDRTRPELIGNSVWETFPETVDSELECAYREARRTGESTTFEFYDEPLDTDFEVHAYPSESGLSVYFRDVTDRKTRERQIEELSERLDLALEGAGIGVWDWNVQTDEVTFDDRWAAMLGYEADEIDAELTAWEDRVHPDDAAAVWEALEAHLEGRTDHYQCDHRMRTKDGSWKWVRDVGKVVDRDSDGDPIRAVGVHIDVTAEVERRRDLERYRWVLDEMPASVALYDADGRFTFVNERLARVYATTPQELVGSESPLLDRLANKRDDDPFGELVAGDRETFSDSMVLSLPDGETIVEYDFSRLVIDGSFDGVLGVFRDVTDERNRAAALERTTARLNALFELAPDMINIHDRSGVIVDGNQAMCEALGYDSAELTDLHVWDVDIGLDPIEAERLWESIDVGEVFEIDTTYRRKDGSRFPVRVHVRRIDVEGDDRFLVTSRDVSEQKAYERRIERENERLDEFASIVSHDLRNPLNVLTGYLELARESGNPDHFDRCDSALADMSNLVEDLLTLARQGKTVGDRESIQLTELVSECWANVAHGPAELALEIDETITLSADPGRLRQLFENLFRNAVEHAGPEVTVTVGVLPAGDGFFVADDGPGIPDANVDQVFKSGFSTDGSGTGFGLAIVASIAEAHGWQIRLASTDTDGARFEFTGIEDVKPQSDAADC